jgi:hypothetical protein
MSWGIDPEAAMLRKVREAAQGSVLETHPHYRTAIGVLGISLPVIVILSSLLQGRPLENSISAYYYREVRDVFVGILWVIGVFLFFYRYRPRDESAAKSDWEPIKSGQADAWLGKIAGVAAVTVALFPTPREGVPLDVPFIGVVHGFAALVLFTCLALFPLLLFSQSELHRRRYRTYGWLMLGLLALTVAYVVAPSDLQRRLAPWYPILVLETLLILLFGISWFDKGTDLAAAAKGRTG